MVLAKAELLENDVRRRRGRHRRHLTQCVRVLAAFSDDLLRPAVDMSGVASHGAHLVTWVLNGCMACRMQLFLYLKACGRAELNTMNLWSGVDAAS